MSSPVPAKVGQEGFLASSSAHASATQSWIKAHMLSTLQPLMEQVKELQADLLRIGRHGADTEGRVDRGAGAVADHYKELLDLRTTMAASTAQMERMQIDLTRVARERNRLETDHEVTKGSLGQTLEQMRPLGVSFEAMQRHVSSLDADFRALRCEVAHKHQNVDEHMERMDRLKDVCEGLNLRHVNMLQDLGDVSRLTSETDRAFQSFIRGHERLEDQRQNDALKVREALWLKEHVVALQQELAEVQRGQLGQKDDVQALGEHVQLLEGGLDEERKKDTQRKLDELHGEHAKIVGQMREALVRLKQAEGGLSSLDIQMEERRGAHESLHEAFETEVKHSHEAERRDAETVVQLRRDLEALDARFGHLSGSLDAMMQAAGKHASMPSRLDYLETSVAQNTARVERAQKDVASLRESRQGGAPGGAAGWGEETRANEVQRRLELRMAALETAVDEQIGDLRAELTRRGGGADAGAAAAEDRGLRTQPRAIALEGRLDLLERGLCDAGSMHAAGLDALEQAHRALRERHDSVHERHARNLEVLKVSHDGHAAVVKSLRDLEAGNSDAYCRQAAELARAQDKFEGLGRRFAALEVAGGEVHDVKQAIERLACEHRALGSGHGSVKDRVQGLEEKVRDLLEGQHKEAQVARARLDRFEGVLEAYERTRGGPGDLERALAGERAWVEERVRGSQVHGDSLRGRVDYLEGALGSSIEELAQKLRTVHAAHAKLASNMAQGLDGDGAPTSPGGGRTIASTSTSGGGGRQNVAELAQWVADVATKLDDTMKAGDAQELANLRLSGQVESHIAKSAKLAARLEDVEQRLAATATDEAKELAAMKADIKEVRERSAKEEAAYQRVLADFDDLRQSTADAFSVGAALQVRYGGLVDRLEQLEAVGGQSAERLEQDLEKVQKASAQLLAQVRDQEALTDDLAEQVKHIRSNMDQTFDDATGLHSTLQERFTLLEENVGKILNNRGKDLSEAKATEVVHADRMAELGRRLEDLAKIADIDKKVDDLAERHALALGQADEKADGLAAGLAEARAREAGLEERLQAWDKSHCLLHTLEVHSGALTEKVASLDDRQAADSTDARAQLKSFRLQHTEDMEQATNAASTALKEHAGEVMKMFGNEHRARESHERAVQETFAKEREWRARQDEAIKELITLEREAREKQRETHHRHLEREGMSREAANNDFHDRLGKEKALRESQSDSHREAAERLFAQVQGGDGKTAALGARLAALECEQRRQQEQLQKASTTLQWVQATVEEREAAEKVAAELAREVHMNQDLRGLQSWRHDATTKLELQNIQVKKAQEDLQQAFLDLRSATSGLGELRQEMMETNMKVNKLDLRYDVCNKHLNGVLKGMQETQRHVHVGEHGPWGRKLLEDYASVLTSPKTPRLPSLPGGTVAGDLATTVRMSPPSAEATRLSTTGSGGGGGGAAGGIRPLSSPGHRAPQPKPSP